MDILLIALLVFAGLAASYLAAMLVMSVAVGLHGTNGRFSEMFTGWFVQQADEFDRRTRRRDIEQEVRRAMGDTDEWGTQQREATVKAARASLEITVAYRLLQKAARQCNAVHFSVADGLGVVDMNEAARHPLCAGHRQRTIDLADLLCDKIERYPLVLDAPELLAVRFGVESIPPTCVRCPYWSCSRSNAPRICPTSRMLGSESSAPAGHTETDADVLDDIT